MAVFSGSVLIFGGVPVPGTDVYSSFKCRNKNVSRWKNLWHDHNTISICQANNFFCVASGLQMFSSATVPVARFFQANIGFMIYHDQIVPLTKLRKIVQRMLKNQLEQRFIRKHRWLSRVDCMKNLQNLPNLPAQSRFGLLNCGEPWRVTCVLAAHLHDSWLIPSNMLQTARWIEGCPLIAIMHSISSISQSSLSQFTASHWKRHPCQQFGLHRVWSSTVRNGEKTAFAKKPIKDHFANGVVISGWWRKMKELEQEMKNWESSIWTSA